MLHFESNHNITLGEVLWESVRTVLGYTKQDLQLLPHQSETEIKPCLDSLDLADTNWTDKRLLHRLRDDLELHLKHRHAFLREKKKRDERKFKVKNFVNDKNFDAARERDQSSAITPEVILQRFQKIDFSSRQIKVTDEATMKGLERVRELVMSDNDINIVTALPPNVQLAILSSNEIHRIDLRAGFTPLRSLVCLSLAGNCVSSLSFVDQLPSLATLDVSFNCIASAEKDVACDAVANHQSLQELNLQGNPICLSSLDWRSQVETALRNCGSGIKSIDGRAVVPGAGAVSHSQRKQSTSTSSAVVAAADTFQVGGSSSVGGGPDKLEHTAAGSSTTAANADGTTAATVPLPLHQIYSDMAVYFQVLNVRGINDLSQKYFNLSPSLCSKVLSSFYNSTILESLNYQYTSPHGGLQAGGNTTTAAAGKSVGAGGANAKLSAAQQQQQAAAIASNPSLGNPGLMQTHDAVLAQFCKEVSSSLRVQVMWFDQQQSALVAAKRQQENAGATLKLSPYEQKRIEQQSAERILQLDDLIAIGGATNASGDDLTDPAFLQQQQELQQQQQQNQSLHHHNASSKKGGSSSKSASKSESKSGGGKGSGSNTGGGGAAAQAAKEASAIALKEQQLQQALQLAASEFVLPVSRPTLSREVMLPVRVGLIFSVVPSSSSSSSSFNQVYNSEKEPAPVATLGWASLSPADLILGYQTSTTISGAKLGVDRATLLTAKERVNKLQVQLQNIKTSLEKEIAENAWRRDTEQAYLNMAASHSAMGKSNRGGAGGAGGAMGKSNRAGVSVRNRAQVVDENSTSHLSPVPVNPMTNAPVTNANIQQIQMEMESFFANQTAARKRAEETCKKLIVEMAVLSVLEGVEENAGRVVVDGKLTLQKASLVPGFDENGEDESAANAANDNKSDRMSQQSTADHAEQAGTKKGGKAGNKNVAAVKKRGK